MDCRPQVRGREVFFEYAEGSPGSKPAAPKCTACPGLSCSLPEPDASFLAATCLSRAWNQIVTGRRCPEVVPGSSTGETGIKQAVATGTLYDSPESGESFLLTKGHGLADHPLASGQVSWGFRHAPVNGESELQFIQASAKAGSPSSASHAAPEPDRSRTSSLGVGDASHVPSAASGESTPSSRDSLALSTANVLPQGPFAFVSFDLFRGAVVYHLPHGQGPEEAVRHALQHAPFPDPLWTHTQAHVPGYPSFFSS